MPAPRSKLTIRQILEWSDAHQRRTGRWPSKKSGPIPRSHGTNWMVIDSALRKGGRGLSGGSSLATLLELRRGRRHWAHPAPLSPSQLIRWADEHRKRTGQWPVPSTGPVHGARDLTWSRIESALRDGSRGLPGGSSLARLLGKYRGRRNKQGLPRLNTRIIHRWARAHRRRAGDWPSKLSGPVVDAPGETWSGVDDALKRGGRGLAPGSSLPKLLALLEGRRHVRMQPPISQWQILIWADEHFRRTGRWPQSKSGRVLGQPQESWGNLHTALVHGRRGLPASLSLPLLLEKHGRKPRQRKGPHLTERQIIRWARRHFRRTGSWPNSKSGAIAGTGGETWGAVANALVQKVRGLPRRITLCRLLVEKCGAWNSRHAPKLSIPLILDWADRHHARTGRWPGSNSGAVTGQPHELWGSINSALAQGIRGLPGGMTLAGLLQEKRGRLHKHRQPRLTYDRILDWADEYYRREGRWPTHNRQPVAPGAHETWSLVSNALVTGQRGLPGGVSLNQLLVRHRGKFDRVNPPRLSVRQILAWADDHHARTGDWPTRLHTVVGGRRQESWRRIDRALVEGRRGLRGGDSLFKLLCAHRMPMYARKGIPLRRSEILDWAATHHELTGSVPTADSGAVRGVPGETWAAIDASLRTGSRGLRGTISLAEFLEEHYVPAGAAVGGRLTERAIIQWAESFMQRVGRWPTRRSAYTDPSRAEKWSVIDLALREGLRGLPGGSSLAKLVRDLARDRQHSRIR